MNILFQDDDIIVCVKPVGVASQNMQGGESMLTLLSDSTGAAVLPVHRLDMNVGGVMVFAKTKRAAAALSADIANRQFEKTYITAVHGETDESGEMCDLLYKDRAKNKTYVVKRARRGVKEAKLQYKRLGISKSQIGTLSFVLVRLLTGRSHQIRVQFASRKHPIAGDGKYGASDNSCKIALWSYRIKFLHPVSRCVMTFCSKPEDMFPWSLFDFADIPDERLVI